MYGSVGGTSGGHGGGVVQLYADDSLTIDGTITANGARSPRNGTGGGSGGSIWIQSKLFSGRGTIQANGGDGLGYGGGGGGGRIAAVFSNSTYTGNIQAFGGRSNFSSGGSGTVYLENKLSSFRKLIVNNKNIGKPSSDSITDINRDGGRTWLTPSNDSQRVVLSHLDIRGMGQLASLTKTTNHSLEWDVGTVTGDQSGLLHILGMQRLVITGEERESKAANLPWGINVYPRGELTLSESFMVDGIQIIVAGRLNGARNLTVANGGKVILRLVRFICIVPNIVWQLHSISFLLAAVIQSHLCHGVVICNVRILDYQFANHVIYLPLLINYYLPMILCQSYSGHQCPLYVPQPGTQLEGGRGSRPQPFLWEVLHVPS